MLKKLLPLLIFSIAQSKEPNPFERLAVDQKLTAVQTTLNSVNSKLCTAGGSKNLKPLIQSLMEQDT